MRRRVGQRVGGTVTRRRSPRGENVAVVARHEIEGVDDAHGPIRRPQLVLRLQRYRRRDHRSGGQGHADVSADGRRVPGIGGGQECLTALPEKNSGGPALRPREAVQVANRAHGADLQACVRRNQRLPTQRRLPRRPGAWSRAVAACARRVPRCRRPVRIPPIYRRSPRLVQGEPRAR
jgi:hypothetical protein